MTNYLFSEATSWNFTLDHYNDVWHVFCQIGIILIFLLLGNCLRKFEFVKKAFIPSALLGGAILLGANALINGIVNKNGGHYSFVDRDIMQVVTYHGLAIGFIAISLKNKTKKRMKLNKVIQNGALTGSTYMLQAILGLSISIFLYFINNKYFYDLGMLLPLGYGQGPGNALTWDVNFSQLVDEFGNAVFTGNGSVGLTIASVGFVVASIFGVAYINIFKGKGEIPERKDTHQAVVEDYVSEGEIGDSDSVDKLSIQVALVMVVYALSFGFMCLMSFSEFTKSLAWGFNFIWGVIFATIFKSLYNLLHKKKIIRHQYVNNYQMDRISGFAFDLMIVAGVAAIDFNNVREYILPIIIMCTVGAFATFFYIRIVTKRYFKGYEHEMFLCNFGTLTGTASNGMILLREIDPNYETDTADLYVASQVPAMVMVAPILFLIAYSAKSLFSSIICLLIFVILFVVYNIIMFISNKDSKSRKK